MNHLEALAGSLTVRPGAPLPDALHSRRRDWAGQIGRGQPASALPGLLSGLFSLCGHAHRLCAQLAVHAAAPDSLAAPADVAQRLRRETAQEHVRRIGLDWPRLLAGRSDDGGCDAALAFLQTCPLLKTSSPTDNPWPAALDWLQRECLQMPAATWLRAWQACGADWLLDWSWRTTGWLPRLLHRSRSADTGPALDMALALRWRVDSDDIPKLAASLGLQSGFALRPQWHGGCAHTGPWARRSGCDDGLALTPWAMLGSRLAELVRLCLHGEHAEGAPWLGSGTLRTGERQGLAWVEMARGLLVHQVEVSPSPEGARVFACRVLAPTEWNAHPHGEMAQRLAALDAAAPAPLLERQVGLLMAAFDPCVPFHIETGQPAAQEVQHA